MFNYFASKKASNFAYIYLAIKKAHKKQVKIVIGFDVILKLWPGVAEQGMALSNNFTALEFHNKKLAFAMPKVQYFYFVNMTRPFTTSSAYFSHFKKYYSPTIIHGKTFVLRLLNRLYSVIHKTQKSKTNVLPCVSE